MSIAKGPRFKYYVSYCLMTEKVNPFGHAALVFSSIDTQDENAQVQVLDAIGLYSRYMPVLGFMPYTPHGRVKAEEHEYIVDQEGLSHITYEISQDEMAALFSDINKDRKKIGNEGPAPQSKNDSQEGGAFKPGGPEFDLINGKNCKHYALEKLEKIGIDTTHLRSFLEIPKNTTGLQPLKIGKKEVEVKEGDLVLDGKIRSKKEKKDIYCWECPLIVSPRTANDKKLHPTTQFTVLKQGVEEMSLVLNNRKQVLREQGRQVQEINNAINNLHRVRQELAATDQKFPNRITSQKINDWVKKVDNIITKETTSLKQKKIEVTLVQSLVDTMKETFWNMYHSCSFWRNGKTTPTEANTYDKIVFNEVEEIKQKLSRITLR